MGKKIKQLFGIVLSLTLIAGLMPQMSMVARATEIGTDISYLGWNDSTKELEEKTAPEGVIALDSTTLVSLKAGYATKLGTAGNTTWYITDGTETTITDSTSISGTVNLILKDSTTLTLNGIGQLSSNGIQMDNGSTLNIYTQSDGANKGVLNVSGYSGVGVERDFMSMSDSNANLNLYGGALSFTGTNDYGITGATTSIYGGTVDVASRLVGFDAGIKGNVISYGGTLTASGGAYTGGSGLEVYPGIEGTITAGDGFTVSVQTKDTEGGTWADATLTDNKTSAQFVKVTAAKSEGGSTPETNGVSYWDWDSSQKKLVEKTGSNACTEYTTVTDSTTEWSDGWYVVSETVTISSRITVTGTAHLILCDGKTLTAGKGITTTGKTLNIYAQSKGDNMGKLIATANTDCCAGIGGIEGGNGGTVTINGGLVEATGGKYAAGIGGGGTNTHEATVGAGGAMTINGGNVKAGYGMGAAGIGGGYNGADLVPGDGADVTINGGTVQAEGNNWAIGGGFKSQNNGTLTLNNGVTMQMKQYDTDDGWLPYDGQTRGAVMQTVSSASSGGTPTGNTTSGGGGGGGGAPASSGETYTIPVENENTVSVGAEIKDGTATVNEITDEQIAQATQPASGSEGAQEQSDTLTIDLSGAKQKVDTVEIPEKTVEKLADAAADSDNNVDKVAVKLSQGEIEFDANAMNTISNEATGSVKVEIAEKKTTDLNASQQASLEGKQTEMVFGVNVSSNGKEIHQFNGNAKVSKNHVATKDKNFYHIEYLPDNGKAQRLVSEHTGNQGIYKERHASDYAIVYDENDQNENIKPIVSVSAKNLTYNGKKQNVKNLKVEVLSVDDVEVPASAYEISGKTSGKNVGTYNISIKAKGDSGFRDGASGTWQINKGKTSFKLKGAKIAAKKLEKKGKTVKVKVNKLSAGASKPTFKIKKVTKGQKKNVEINKKTGAVTIKKGCGKCEITVVATSKANKNRKKGKATAKVVVK
ncbi:hypothetical protein SAMN05216391_106100 [Lachnospiraceae bacterium KHCPX20]|nr:hypothetical protein SAMN05216391_106100 [Lachnospiraceae bacterium KHCPX20]